jgi:subtilisin family serine protease
MRIPSTSPRRYIRAAGVAGVVLSAVVALAAAPAYAAERPLASVAGATVIPGSYVVTFKPGASHAGDLAGAAANRHGMTVAHVYRGVLHGAAFKGTDRQARRLAADPAVESVTPDVVAYPSATTQTLAPPQLDRIDQRTLVPSTTYVYTTSASSVRAYIIDSGIRATHNDFGTRVSLGTDITGGDGSDCFGHGTPVASQTGGAYAGVAKAVKLVNVRIAGCAGTTSSANVIAGLDWVRLNAIKPAVANLSYGVASIFAPLDAAAAGLVTSGIALTVSAGNDNIDACGASPARAPSAITVGATNILDTRSIFSNYGACLDLFAPGDGNHAAYNTSNSAFVAINGTSFAAPLVAGAIAVYLQNNPTATPATIAATITNNATSGGLLLIGAGSPNRLLFTS